MNRLITTLLLSIILAVPSVADDKIDMPEFPGGRRELQKFLAENVIYPTAARQMEITGEVVVEFVVERSGVLTGINIVKGLSPELDQEALRVVKLMPKWKAGRKNGVPTRVKMTMPINFKLHKTNDKYLNTSEAPLKPVTSRKQARRR